MLPSFPCCISLRDLSPSSRVQDLIEHVSNIKEGKESMKNEVLLALHNKGEEEAKQRCAAVLVNVNIWHGR